MSNKKTAYSDNFSAKIRPFLHFNEKQMLADLKAMVECNTFSSNKAHLDRIQEIIKNFMPSGYELAIDRQEKTGNNYVYRYRAPSQDPIALHGHLDTLCPDDPQFNTIREIDGRIYGPGTHDMKGGVLVLVWALKALEHFGLLDKMSLTVIFNTDEETGSNNSKHLFFDLARENTRLAIKFECGELENTIVTTRKGMAKFVLRAHGENRHFGNLKVPKRSAIEEIAHKILLIEGLNSEHIAANVGRVEGGIVSNITAEHASINFEVRSWDADHLKECVNFIHRECVKNKIPGVALKLEQTVLIEPWSPCEKSRAVFALICQLAEDAGFQKIVEEKRGGISDSNQTSAAGIPAIDGMGAIGSGDCTHSEHILKQSIFERIELVVKLLLELDQQPVL